jgi:hypothetical protein
MILLKDKKYLSNIKKSIPEGYKVSCKKTNFMGDVRYIIKLLDNNGNSVHSEIMTIQEHTKHKEALEVFNAMKNYLREKEK